MPVFLIIAESLVYMLEFYLPSISIIKCDKITLLGFKNTSMHFFELMRINLSRLSYALTFSVCDSK